MHTCLICNCTKVWHKNRRHSCSQSLICNIAWNGRPTTAVNNTHAVACATTCGSLSTCHRWDVPTLKTFEELIYYNYVFVMIHDTGCIWYIFTSCIFHTHIQSFHIYLPAQITTATSLSWLYTSEGCFRFFSPYGANVSLRPLKRTWRTGQSWGRHGLADGNTGWCHRCCLVVTFWPCIFETFWDIRWI